MILIVRQGQRLTPLSSAPLSSFLTHLTCFPRNTEYSCMSFSVQTSFIRYLKLAIFISGTKISSSLKEMSPHHLKSYATLCLCRFCYRMCRLDRNDKLHRTDQNFDELNSVWMVWTLWAWKPDNDGLSLFKFKTETLSMVRANEKQRCLFLPDSFTCRGFCRKKILDII